MKHPWLVLVASAVACVTVWTAFAMMLPHVRTGDLGAVLRLAAIALVVGVLPLMVVALTARRP
jgi:hypothetical protein